MLWFLFSLIIDYPVVVFLGVIIVWILLRQDAAEVLRQQLAAAPKVPQEDTPASAALAERLGKLETASQGWKKRIAQSDAVQFSVAGRMALAPSPIPVSPLHSPAAERKKRTPKPNRFRSKEGEFVFNSNNTDNLKSYQLITDTYFKIFTTYELTLILYFLLIFVFNGHNDFSETIRPIFLIIVNLEVYCLPIKYI